MLAHMRFRSASGGGRPEAGVGGLFDAASRPDHRAATSGSGPWKSGRRTVRRAPGAGFSKPAHGTQKRHRQADAGATLPVPAAHCQIGLPRASTTAMATGAAARPGKTPAKPDWFAAAYSSVLIVQRNNTGLDGRKLQVCNSW